MPRPSWALWFCWPLRWRWNFKWLHGDIHYATEWACGLFAITQYVHVDTERPDDQE